jgi:hypothetical protein
MTLNKRSLVTYENKEVTVEELATFLDVNISTLLGRISRGDPENKWGVKHRNQKLINHMGVTFPSVRALSEHLGVSTNTVTSRKSSGKPDWKWGEPVRYFPTDAERNRERSKRRCGYCLANMPEEVQQMAISLAGSLGVEPVEAYAQMLEGLV